MCSLSCEATEVAESLAEFRLLPELGKKNIQQREGMDDAKLLILAPSKKLIECRTWIHEAAIPFRIVITEVAIKIDEQGRGNRDKGHRRLYAFLSNIYPLDHYSA